MIIDMLNLMSGSGRKGRRRTRRKPKRLVKLRKSRLIVKNGKTKGLVMPDGSKKKINTDDFKSLYKAITQELKNLRKSSGRVPRMPRVKSIKEKISRFDPAEQAAEIEKGNDELIEEVLRTNPDLTKEQLDEVRKKADRPQIVPLLITNFLREFRENQRLEMIKQLEQDRQGIEAQIAESQKRAAADREQLQLEIQAKKQEVDDIARKLDEDKARGSKINEELERQLKESRRTVEELEREARRQTKELEAEKQRIQQIVETARRDEEATKKQIATLQGELERAKDSSRVNMDRLTAQLDQTKLDTISLQVRNKQLTEKYEREIKQLRAKDELTKEEFSRREDELKEELERERAKLSTKLEEKEREIKERILIEKRSLEELEKRKMEEIELVKKQALEEKERKEAAVKELDELKQRLEDEARAEREEKERREEQRRQAIADAEAARERRAEEKRLAEIAKLNPNNVRWAKAWGELKRKGVRIGPPPPGTGYGDKDFRELIKRLAKENGVRIDPKAKPNKDEPQAEEVEAPLEPQAEEVEAVEEAPNKGDAPLEPQAEEVEAPLEPQAEGQGDNKYKDPDGQNETELYKVARGIEGFIDVCTSDEILNYKDELLDESKDGYNFLIVNTITRAEAGKITGHWVLVSTEVNYDDGRFTIMYFDPLGDPVPDNIFNQLKKLVEEEPFMYEFKVNLVPTQSEQSDLCGWHVLYLMQQLEDGVPWREATRFTDEEAAETRAEFEDI